MPVFEIGDLLKQGWEKYKKHFLFVWKVLGTVILVSVIFHWLGTVTEKNAPLTLLVTLASIYCTIVVEIGMYKMLLRLVDTDTEDPWKNMFQQYRLFWRYLFASIGFGLCVGVGFVLLIIPGVYLLLKYQFFGYAMIDKDLKIADAFRESAAMTKDIKWKLLGFAIVLVIVNLIGAVLIGIGLIVTVPVSLLANFILYRKLSQRMEPVAISASPVPAPPAAPVASPVPEPAETPAPQA